MTTDATSERQSERPRANLRGVRLVGLFTLVSRLLGMVRDVAMAAAFGAGPVMDAFSVAFRIPNLARRLFGEGAQTSAFLPAFVRTQEQAGAAAARELAGGMFLNLGLLLAALVVIAEVTLALVWWLVPLSSDAALLTELLLWLLPYLICICLAAQQSAVLHGLRQFGWPAALPVVLNLIWLAAIPLTFAVTEDPVRRIRGLCVSILLAGVLQLLIPVWLLRRQGYPLTARGPAARARVGEVFRAMGPVLLGVTVTQINTVCDSLLAWWLAPGGNASGGTALTDWLPQLPNGTASALYFGQRLYQFPLGLIGVGLGTVLFPQFARHAGRGDRAGLNRDLTDGLRLTLSIGVPAGLGLMLLATPITRLLFERGAFTPEAAALTSQMIVAYGPGVPAFIALLIVQRGYYALDDRVTPLRHGLLAMGLNLLLDVGLLFPCGASGLAWATSLSACAQAGLAVWGLQPLVGRWPWRELGAVAARTAAGCAIMSAACCAALPDATGSWHNRLLSVLAPLVAGGLVYLASAWVMGLRDPLELICRGSVERRSGD